MMKSIIMITRRLRYLTGRGMAAGMLSMTVFTAAAAEGQAVNCDIHKGPCIAEARDGTRVELEILPRPVTAMSDLSFLVTLSQKGNPVLDAPVVLLEFTMPGMYMGKNQVALKRRKNGRYEGHGTITRCVSGSKTWKAKVTASHAGKTAAADFIFEVR
jgi:hypothetical protein